MLRTLHLTHDVYLHHCCRCPLLLHPFMRSAAEIIKRNYAENHDDVGLIHDHDIDTEKKTPAGLEGKRWRDFRKKQKLDNNIWRPNKRLGSYQMDHMRTLKKMQPEEWSHEKLAHHFGVSIPAVIRILRSKFEPSPEVRQKQDAKAMRQVEERREKFQKALALEYARHNRISEKDRRGRPVNLPYPASVKY